MNTENLDDYLSAVGEKYDIPAYSCAVMVDHNLCYHKNFGFSDREKNVKASDNDLYFLYSATKVITCTAVLQLVENNILLLEDEVCKYLPEFTEMQVLTENGLKTAENKITIRHLLTMCGGLSYHTDTEFIRDTRVKTGGTANTRKMVGAIAKEPLLFEPGTHFEYSLCHDVLGAVIEVVSEKSLGEYLNENIFNPLGMTNTGFALTEDIKNRMSAQYTYDTENRTSRAIEETNGFRLTEVYESGGAGLISNPSDYILFADALANDGVGKSGAIILKGESIDLMRQNHLHGDCLKDFEKLCHKGYGYGLGVRTLIDENFGKSPLGEFGWDGAAGAYVLIDPKNKLSIFYAQHVTGCNVAPDEIHPTIKNLVYEGLMR